MLKPCPCNVKVVLLDKFLITVVAVEWFFTSVKPFMHSQVALLDEFLVTVVAIEWLFSNAFSGCPSGRIPYLSEQQIIIKSKQQNLVEIPDFFVHY